MKSDDEVTGGSICPAKKSTGNGSHSSCVYCGEPVLPYERQSPIKMISDDGSIAPLHFECQFRMFMGSVGHLRGECRCHGVEDASEVGMTRRQSAKAAWDYFQEKHTGYQFGNP